MQNQKPKWLTTQQQQKKKKNEQKADDAINTKHERKMCPIAAIWLKEACPSSNIFLSYEIYSPNEDVLVLGKRKIKILEKNYSGTRLTIVLGIFYPSTIENVQKREY